MDSNPATPAGGYDVMHAGFGSQADAMWVVIYAYTLKYRPFLHAQLSFCWSAECLVAPWFSVHLISPHTKNGVRCGNSIWGFFYMIPKQGEGMSKKDVDTKCLDWKSSWNVFATLLTFALLLEDPKALNDTKLEIIPWAPSEIWQPW